MSDSEDLFGQSSDGEATDDLIASSKAKAKPAAKPKRLQKKKKVNDASIPDADDDSDDDLEDSDNEGTTESTKILSKRERMDKLKAKRRAALDTEEAPQRPSTTKSSMNTDAQKEKGYESGESIDSAQYQRTKEDDDFIDADDEDPDALAELYAEQHFDNEGLEHMEDNDEGKPKKASKGGKKRKAYSGPDSISGMIQDGKVPDNPILAVVQRMKKKKNKAKGFEELKSAAVELISRMERAADEDDLAIQERKPATTKLLMLQDVLDMATKREMVRPLLDSSFLIAAKRWIEPLPNGTLGNVTLRHKIIHLISSMNGIDSDDLKQSEFGKLVMTLYMHKKETSDMKVQLKSLIEQWSRRIFNKSGNMKDLDVSNRRVETSMGGFAQGNPNTNSRREFMNEKDYLQSVMNSNSVNANSLGKNRVSIPYSRGFKYTVRPDSLSGEVADKRNRVSNNNIAEGRDSLHRRMLDKKRPSSKNQRSANISVGGRPSK